MSQGGQNFLPAFAEAQVPRCAHRIVCVGRRAQDPFLDAADVYVGRLGRYAQVELLRLKDGSKASEAAQMLQATPKGSVTVALDEHGQNWSTEALCAFLRPHVATGQQLTYYVGGADGLGDAAKAVARHTWALSALTLPHRAALALLAEALYRAHTVLAGERYHRP